MHPLHQLCDRCIGRFELGAQGPERQCPAGASKRQELAMESTPETDCRLCEGLFLNEATWLQLAKDALADVEFSSIQAGTMFAPEIQELEKEIRTELGIESTEGLRTEANRWLLPTLAADLGVEAMKEGRPDVVVLVDTQFHHATVQRNSLYMAGRYNKFRRDIPQTHWPCKRCQGLGCWDCEDSGVQYAESVEQSIGDLAKVAFDAESYSFHGAGREDIDALMLGGGRPFVLELNSPRLRTTDFAALEAAINASTETSGVAVQGLRPTEKEEVARIKGADYQKSYIAHCLLDEPVTAEELEATIAQFQGVTLQQRTPERVSHRRADLIRERTVESVGLVEPLSEDGLRFSISVLAESGTYIKEFVSGDEGRTNPNFVGALGRSGKVEFLDVMDIHDTP